MDAMKTYEAEVRVTFVVDAPDSETALTLVNWACKNAQWAERYRWVRLVVIADGEEVDNGRDSSTGRAGVS